MTMAYENNYRLHDRPDTNTISNNIDLSNSDLFEYVLELEQLKKLTSNVGPKNLDTFGTLEGFDEGERSSNAYLIVFIILGLLIIIFGYIMLTGTDCGDVHTGQSSYLSHNNAGQLRRAIFVNN